MPLNLRQIAESAALVSSRASLLIEGRSGIPEAKLQCYWTNCRSRSNEWIKQLDCYSCRLNEEVITEHPQIWMELEPLLNEIFVSEILTRVWAAVLTATDQRHQKKLSAPIARHTVSLHIDARHRAMSLMVSGPQVSLAELARVDRVRRKAERWSDILIGQFVTRYGLEELAFDVQRSIEFADSQVREILKATDEPVWEFVLAGIRIAFATLGSVSAPSAAAHSAILSSVMGCFPADIFDCMGLTRPVFQVRTERGPASDVSPFRPVPQAPVDRGSRHISFADLRSRNGNN